MQAGRVDSSTKEKRLIGHIGRIEKSLLKMAHNQNGDDRESKFISRDSNKKPVSPCSVKPSHLEICPPVEPRYLVPFPPNNSTECRRNIGFPKIATSRCAILKFTGTTPLRSLTSLSPFSDCRENRMMSLHSKAKAREPFDPRALRNICRNYSGLVSFLGGSKRRLERFGGNPRPPGK